MKKRLLFILISILVLASCRPFDDCEFDDQRGIAIVLEFTDVTKPVNDISIYVFDASNRLDMHKHFLSEEELTARRLYVDNGTHTIIALLNVGEDFAMPLSSIVKTSSNEINDLMLDDFIAWVRSVESQYPDMMTGMAKDLNYDDQTRTITIEIADGTTNLTSSVLRLKITAPSEINNVSGHNMRTVAEVYKKGAILRIHSHSGVLTNSTLDLHLQPGDYDILLWTDYTPTGSVVDHHYSTSSLRGVTFNEQKDYVSGVDSRNAFALNFEATVADQPITEKHIILEHVFAKYRIVATDVERYGNFRIANSELGYQEITDLVATISYEGFFPNSYDMRTGEPNNSVLQMKYTYPLTDITGTTATIGNDYIFAGASDAYLNATVTISNKETGDVITTVPNVRISTKKSGAVITNVPSVRIDYQRGNTTIIKSDYLTAGVITQGVSIDTRWEGVIDFYF